MSARAKITMSPEEYLRGLHELEAATAKSTNKMENSFKQYGTAINKAGIAMRYVSSEMGAGAVAIGRAFQVGAGGKIALAAAGIATAFTAIKKIWDELTVSATELISKLGTITEIERKQLDATRKTEAEEDSLMERLSELAKREDKTTEEKNEQIRLAEILAGRYEKLGVSISDLTGDYETLLKAMKKIDNEQTEGKSSQLETLSKDQSTLIEEQFRKNITPGFWGKAWKMLSFGSGKSVDQQVNDFRWLLPAQQEAFVTEKIRGSKTEEDKQKWASLIPLIDKQKETREQLWNLENKGKETLKEETSELEKQSEAARKAKEERKAADDARVAELDEEARKQEEIDRKHGEALAKELEKEQQIARERQKAAEQRRTNDIASLRGAAYRALGMGEQADIEAAVYAETQANGGAIDEKTRAEITARVKARRALEKAMQTSTSPELYAPRVDSLIARGGSATPVKMPKVEDLQSKQLNAQNKTNQIAMRILNQMDGWNTI